ncbi:hypothetical protein C8F01DRAFT_1234902 [Mycena amicta]|nr:hypothetical protein C8F01DRAFT_1234902 [Mycena amicta]
MPSLQTALSICVKDATLSTLKSQNTNQDLHAGSAQAQFPSVVSLSSIAQLSGSQPTDPMMDDGEEGPDGPTLGDMSVTIQMAACLPVHGHEVSRHARLTHLTRFSNASTPKYHYVHVALKSCRHGGTQSRRTDRHRLERGGGERPSDDNEPRRRRRWMDLDGENRSNASSEQRLDKQIEPASSDTPGSSYSPFTALPPPFYHGQWH